MRAAVLGGSGFLGSHVADALTAAGHRVTVVDLVRSPHLGDEQSFVAADITDLESLRAALAGNDVVYNFAGIADIDRARRVPVDTARVNVVGNANALQAAVDAGVRRYIFASSIYVASEAGSFYRVSKQACELYIEEFSREHPGLQHTILRYGTLYGRRAGIENSVHRYLRQALLQRRIEASGTGDELREYIHVEDAARLSVEILGDEFAGEQVVLTGHHPMRYRDLLALIREIVGDDVQIEMRPGEGSAHYAITPYTFRPRVARKLVSSYYVDMGQGLVDCLSEIAELEGQPRP